MMPRFHWDDALPKDPLTGQPIKPTIFDKDPIMKDISVRDKMKVLGTREGKVKQLTEEQREKLYKALDSHKRITEENASAINAELPAVVLEPTADNVTRTKQILAYDGDYTEPPVKIMGNIRPKWGGYACKREFDRYMICVQNSIDVGPSCEMERTQLALCKYHTHAGGEFSEDEFRLQNTNDHQ